MNDGIASSGQQIETRKDLGKGDVGLYAYWMLQDKIAGKEEETWAGKSRKIIQRYRDEDRSSGFASKDASRFNILWSNVQTLLPTLFARTPKPDVQRRFLDSDPTGRLASLLLERCLSYSLEDNFDATMKAAVLDRLLPGRAAARVRYVPTFGDAIEDKAAGGAADAAADDQAPTDESEAPAEKPAPLRRVEDEKAAVEYVFWEDYREGPARTWKEVPWVRYRCYLTKDALTQRFGKKKAAEVNLDFTPKGTSDKDETPPDAYKKAIVYEFWDKTREEVIWLAPGTPDVILDRKADPLELPGFFPGPDPLLATTTNEKRIPVPDYVEYQDQARELDKITARIDKLTDALKVAGFYPGENKQEIQNVFDAGKENKLIPIADWQGFTEKLGKSGFIEWVPIQQIAQTLVQLYNARDRVKAILYEVTGLSDILRGETAPQETFGAQQLKANFATRRIAPQQKEVARFARDLVRLMGGIVAMHFSKETISKITGYPQLEPVPALPPQPKPPMAMLPASMPGPAMGGSGAPVGVGGQPDAGGAPPIDPAMQQAQQAAQAQQQAYQQQMAAFQQQVQAIQAVVQANAQKTAQFEAAVQLIQKDGPHGFRIDIETDSTIAPDEQAEKEARTELLQQLIPLLAQVMPIAQGNPAMAAMCREIVLFALRGFRVARQLEEVVEQAFDAIGQMAPNPKVSGEPQQAKQGADPKDVAAQVVGKAHEVQTKQETERLKIAQQSQDAAADRKLEAVKIVGDQSLRRDGLMLEAQRFASEDAHRHEIDTHRQTMEASNLT